MLAEHYDAFLFDLDGVLYRGDRAVPHAADAVATLRERGAGIAFVTNNSAATPEAVAGKLGALGIEARPKEVVTSAVATSRLLAERGGGSAFVIGETGIRTALAEAGIEVRDGSPDTVDWVVVGWDRGADYARLKTAALLVQGGARLVATNADPSYPAADGAWPGAGALLAVVTTTTGAVPEVVGKPHAPLFEAAREAAGGGRVIFVGDRLDTDVAGAAGLGWDSLLVFTGIATRPDLVRSRSLPTFAGDDLRVLLAEAPRIRSAAEADEDAIVALLERSGLDPGGAAERVDETVVADVGGTVVGTAAVEVQGDLAHLRSVAVDGRCRGARVGTMLVAHAVRMAGEARHVLLATESAEPFFTGLGFVTIGRLDAMPDVFRRDATVCSESAAVMRLELAP